MTMRVRWYDGLVLGAVVLVSAGLLLSTRHTVDVQSQQEHCTATLSRFGQASAIYEAAYAAFTPCDPWPRLQECTNRDRTNCRDDSLRYDPPHSWLAFYGLDVRPAIPTQDPQAPWNAYPYGFTFQGLADPASLWDGFFCPSQNRQATSSPQSTEIDFRVSQYSTGAIYTQSSGYMANRLLRCDLRGRRFPLLPDPGLDYQTVDNMFSIAAVRLTIPETEGKRNRCFVQAVSSAEVRKPDDVAYMVDSLDHRIGNDHPHDELVQPEHGHAKVTAGMYMGLNAAAPSLVLGARHGGKANVLYVDGHISDSNQTPRNRRGELVTASTFADFISDHGIGTQHHVMPQYTQIPDDAGAQRTRHTAPTPNTLYTLSPGPS